jgi:hypothetical protein
VCEILPHLGFQCSVKTLNDTGFGLLVVSGKEVHVVFLQADLVDLAKLSSYNKGFKYLLTCIDVLSRYAWVVPLKELLPSWSQPPF